MSRGKRWTILLTASGVIATIVMTVIMLGQLRVAEDQATSGDQNARDLAGMIVQTRELILQATNPTRLTSTVRCSPLIAAEGEDSIGGIWEVEVRLHNEGRGARDFNVTLAATASPLSLHPVISGEPTLLTAAELSEDEELVSPRMRFFHAVSGEAVASITPDLLADVATSRLLLAVDGRITFVDMQGQPQCTSFRSEWDPSSREWVEGRTTSLLACAQ